MIRYRRENLDRLIDDINATGYGLTFGLHTRIDETAERVASRVEVGNIYINRNIIGAIVGVQPFGGSGLSGTGPKAGGPLYLLRLLSVRPETGLAVEPLEAALAPAIKYRDWLSADGHDAEAAHVDEYINRSPLGISMELPGPVGERNVYALRRRGQVLLLPETQSGLLIQIGAALATGNPMLVKAESAIAGVLSRMPVDLATRIEKVSDWTEVSSIAAVLVEGTPQRVLEINRVVAELMGRIVTVQGASTSGLERGTEDYCLDWLIEEVSTSINTAAAGGNASLMAIS